MICTGTVRKLHPTQVKVDKPNQGVLFKKLEFEELGVNQLSS